MYHYFKKIFGTSHHSPVTADWSVLYPQEQPTQAQLTDPFSEEESKAAVFDLGSDKAPGPDGFPVFFFQHFWDLIKQDLIDIFNDPHQGDLDYKHINSALIVIIPKKHGASSPQEFRPISLLNSSYKIVSKVLSNRLKQVLDLYDEPTQSAFLQNRSTLDSVATAQEIVNACLHHHWPAVFLKIDFQKAFDVVS